MIETKAMTIEDYLEVMGVNADVYPGFARLSREQQEYLANLNLITGEAKSFFEDGKLVGVGGIRYVGVGEAWMISIKQTRERPFALLRETKKAFVKMRDELNLWRVFATSQISENFLRHLGFEKNENPHTWTRTDETK